MRTGWLDIKLVSELCAATGDGTAGLIDTEIAHEYGLPIIPAKRIKGALREVGKELVDWGLIEEAHAAQLFGMPGQVSGGCLQVYDARLYKVPESGGCRVIENYEELCRQLKRQQQHKTHDILSLFTQICVRTAIDEHTGTAAVGTLRTMRVVNKDIVMRSRLELAGVDEADLSVLEKTLELCVKGLRQLGLANTRGYGEVCCTLTPLEDQELSEVKRESSPVPSILNVSGDSWKIVPYDLELEQPVIIAGRDGAYHRYEEWIPGSALLGAAASMYIAEHQLGDRAHEDEDFARIFLRGGVQFGYALPLVNEHVLAPCPAMWQQVKNSDHGYQLGIDSSLDSTMLRSIKAMVYMDWQQDSPVMHCYRPEKQVRMHHARARNRAIGRALGAELTAAERTAGIPVETKPADRGQLYQYVSLEAGRRFSGTLRGQAKDIDAVIHCLERNGNRLRIGRSRTAEYGNVRFIANTPERPLLYSDTAKDAQLTTRIAIHLVSPMLLLDDAGRPDPDPRWLLEQINSKLKCGAVLQFQQLKYTVLGGFHAKWRLPKPQRPALDAGSSIVLETKQAINPKDLENVLWGWNVGEGNGQVRALPLDAQEAVQFVIDPSPWKESDDELTLEPSPPPHDFLTYLYERLEQIEQERKAQWNGIDAAQELDENVLTIGQTKLHQLRDWSKGGYERMEANVRKMNEGEVKKACEEIISHCQDKDQPFIAAYLRMLELKVRQKT